MADNIEHATGADVATDDVGSRHFQWVKLKIGGEGVANDPSATSPLWVRETNGTQSIPPNILAGGAIMGDSSENFTKVARDSGSGTFNSDNVSRNARTAQTGSEFEMAAGSATVYYRVHGLYAHSDTATKFRFLDGSGGSALSGWYAAPVLPSYLWLPPSVWNLSAPGTINTALYVDLDNASATIDITAWIHLIA